MESNDRPTPIERLVRPFQIFAENKVAGAVCLLATTVVALVWANSPWASVYFATLATKITFSVGEFALSKPLLIWINDGLMAIFFFVVGLEIKREILEGELSTLRKAGLPVAAAFGGMAVPALVYITLNLDGPGERGWGIPMATDIAFSLGVLLLLGPRVPLALKVFLTALAIVDDIGAILVIAVFYSQGIALATLLAGGLLLLVSLLANWAGMRSPAAYFIIGLLVWLAFLKSGVHATLAAVLLAMTIPARVSVDCRAFIERMGRLLEAFREKSSYGKASKLLTGQQQAILAQINSLVDKAGAPVQQLEHALLPVVTFLVLPVFALANAGVAVEGDIFAAFTDRVTLGIILGLFVGKQVGILGFSWLAVKLNLADLPSQVTWRQIHAVGLLAGIGFTMSLFVGSLAFVDSDLQQLAKVGILTGSLLSGLAGGWLLLRSRPDSVQD